MPEVINDASLSFTMPNSPVQARQCPLAVPDPARANRETTPSTQLAATTDIPISGISRLGIPGQDQCSLIDTV